MTGDQAPVSGLTESQADYLDGWIDFYAGPRAPALESPIALFEAGIVNTLRVWGRRRSQARQAQEATR